MAQPTGVPDEDAARARAADARESALDAREAALDARDSVLDQAEAAQDAREVEVRKILVDADSRDVVSNARDSDADDREGAASLAAFLGDETDAPQPGVRRAAALDRLHSKSDRSSAASDRVELAGTEARPPDDPRSGA